MIVFDRRPTDPQLGTKEGTLLSHKGWEACMEWSWENPNPWVLIISHSTLFCLPFLHLTLAPHDIQLWELEMSFLEEKRIGADKVTCRQTLAGLSFKGRNPWVGFIETTKPTWQRGLPKWRATALPEWAAMTMQLPIRGSVQGAAGDHPGDSNTEPHKALAIQSLRHCISVMLEV